MNPRCCTSATASYCPSGPSWRWRWWSFRRFGSVLWWSVSCWTLGFWEQNGCHFLSVLLQPISILSIYQHKTAVFSNIFSGGSFFSSHDFGEKWVILVKSLVFKHRFFPLEMLGAWWSAEIWTFVSFRRFSPRLVWFLFFWKQHPSTSQTQRALVRWIFSIEVSIGFKI